jgi:S1-C subfamily serine protease
MNRFRAWPLLAALIARLAAGPAPAVTSEGGTDARRDATVVAIEKVLPSVVNIATTTIVETRDLYSQLMRDFTGVNIPGQKQRVPFSIGSGVVIDEEGYVLTNDHVVRRASEIWVKLADGRERQADRVVTTARSDVTLLKIRAETGDKFTPARFAADDDLLLGETVIALGNPYGLGGSVTRGILSSKSRRPPPEVGAFNVADWLQTDAAINPGSSGGPLVNLRGELIGLNVAVAPEGQGIGFAIPIRLITDSLAEIFTPERMKGLWFGALVKAVSSVSPALAIKGPAGDTTTAPVPGTGLSVIAVEPESPAHRAALRPGDVITQVNGKTPRTFVDFVQELIATGDKRDVKLTVRRGDREAATTVQLVPEKDVFNAALIRRKIGVTLKEIAPPMADQLKVQFGQAFVISAVEPDSPAADAQLQRGMIVRAVDGRVPADLTQAARILFAKKKGDKVELDIQILRSTGSLTLTQQATATLTVN